MDTEPISQIFPVSITSSALVQVRKLLAKSGDPSSRLRLGIKGGGCSGLEYVMKIEAGSRPGDLEEEIDGVKIVCDAKSAQLLQGSVFDYTGNLIGGGFRFENPNATRTCGCGTSFTPKPRTPQK